MKRALFIVALWPAIATAGPGPLYPQCLAPVLGQSNPIYCTGDSTPCKATTFTGTAADDTCMIAPAVDGARVCFNPSGSMYWESNGGGSIVTATAVIAGSNFTVNGNAAFKFGTASTFGNGGPVVPATVITTGVGNLGASGPDNLTTYSIPAGVLNANGRCVRITGYGTSANNANAKTLRLAAGASLTPLVTKQLTVSIVGTWEVSGMICRTGVDTQDYFATAYNNGGTTVTSVEGATVLKQAAFGTLTEDDANPIDIRIQSTTTTADNDIVAQGMIIEVF